MHRTFSLRKAIQVRLQHAAAGAAPLESSFSEEEPWALRLTLEPLGRRRLLWHDATRPPTRCAASRTRCRNEALRWFDRVASHGWLERVLSSALRRSRLVLDDAGLRTTKVLLRAASRSARWLASLPELMASERYERLPT